jgi:hypothetical protein
MQTSPPLNEFWVVTGTSLYHVTNEQTTAVATKTKVHTGQSEIQAKSQLPGGSMIAIGSEGLLAYTPEGSGLVSPVSTTQRDPEMVNSRYLGCSTSPIIALFLDEKSAEECTKSGELKTSDPRWKDQTRAVLETIGNDHPTFFVCPKGSKMMGSLMD